MKDIPGFEGIYSCNELGEIYAKERIIKRNMCDCKKNIDWLLPLKKLQSNKRRDGYWQIRLRLNGKSYSHLVHRLIAKTFLGCTNQEVNHKDGNKDNNKVSNLELCSRSYNIKHAFSIGKKTHKGESHPKYFITEELSQKVLKDLSLNMSQSKIAKKYGMSQSSVSSIKRKNIKQ